MSLWPIFLPCASGTYRCAVRGIRGHKFPIHAAPGVDALDELGIVRGVFRRTQRVALAQRRKPLLHARREDGRSRIAHVAAGLLVAGHPKHRSGSERTSDPGELTVQLAVLLAGSAGGRLATWLSVRWRRSRWTRSYGPRNEYRQWARPQDVGVVIRRSGTVAQGFAAVIGKS